MAGKKQTYFVLNHKGITLKLLSVLENKNYSLTIFPSRAENYSEIQYGNNDADQLIENQKYSIHNSDESKFDNNYIHHTINHPNNKTQESVIVTQALKSTNLHVPLYSARTMDLSNERYIISRKEKNEYIELGDYTPKKSTLYYMLVISSKPPEVKNDDFNIVTVPFNRYCVTIFWSFGIIPSHTTGEKIHFFTINDSSFQQKLTYGFESIELQTLFKFHRQTQHLNFIDFIHKIYPHIQESNTVKYLGFKKKSSDSINAEDIKNVQYYSATESYLIGQSLANTIESEKALEAYNHSLELYSKLGLYVEVANVKNSQAVLFQSIGKVDEAIQIYSELVDLYFEYNLPFQLARTYLNKSIVFRDMGKTIEAINYAEDSFKLCTSKNLTSFLPEIQQELGILYMHSGDLKKAKKKN